MPAGIQVFNPNGSMRFDSSKRVSRLVATVQVTSATSGSYTNSAYSLGTPFGVFIPNNSSHGVKISFSGNTLNWSKNVPTIPSSGSIVTFVY